MKYSLALYASLVALLALSTCSPRSLVCYDPSMIFTDSHAHLSSVAEEMGAEAFSALLADYAEAAAAAVKEGRAPPLLLDVGTEPLDLRARAALLDLGDRAISGASFLRLSAGIWPSAENLASPRSGLSALEAAIVEAGRSGRSIAAIGEGGLDYHHMEGGAAAQGELFAGQLSLASRLGLPMIVHSRDAAEATLSLIKEAKASSPVIIHCFGYGSGEARAFLDLGCHLSFAGNLTYKGSEGLRAACAIVPEGKLLLETDSPYMNPLPRRGKPASPRDIERTYAFAAELRGVEVADLAETVSRNAHTLFG
jgi:TatD DNase family protein